MGRDSFSISFTLFTLSVFCPQTLTLTGLLLHAAPDKELYVNELIERQAIAPAELKTKGLLKAKNETQSEFMRDLVQTKKLCFLKKSSSTLALKRSTQSTWGGGGALCHRPFHYFNDPLPPLLRLSGIIKLYIIWTCFYVKALWA